MAERNPILSDAAARDELRWCLARCRAPRLRTMREFAEQEIVLPSGPFQGRHFSLDRQPFAAQLFAAIDSGRYARIAVTGPSQSGKTLCGTIVPLLWHLFEFGERVVFGLPDLDMAADKWRDDILPVLERTRYRDLLPQAGGGSRGGKVMAVKFRNGAVLRFMSGGGSDKARSSYTTRVLIVTETDGMDTAGGGSREANKIAQLEARTRAYGHRKRVYLECTVSTEQGRIWTEYQQGTASRLMLPCPHCRAFVLPEREHLHGWQEAETEVQAAADSAFYCPDCGEEWTEDDRRQANLAARLVHRGQEIDADGQVHGAEPATNTLGFRWSAVNNLFTDAGELGAALWRAKRAHDEEDAEKELCQFIFTQPYKPPGLDDRPLSVEAILARSAKWPKGFVPAGCTSLGLGVDLGKRLAHYTLVGILGDDRPHVIDYGLLEIPADTLGVEAATRLALRELRELVLSGWPAENGPAMLPGQVWIDAAWADSQAEVFSFCREAGDRFRPTLGYARQHKSQHAYKTPPKKTDTIRFIGDGYHLARHQEAKILVVHVNADVHKGRVHDALSIAAGAPGGLTLFGDAEPDGRLRYAKHLVAERRVMEFEPGRGDVIRWHVVSHNNHYLDATALAYGAARHAAAAGQPAARPAAAKGRFFANRKKR